MKTSVFCFAQALCVLLPVLSVSAQTTITERGWHHRVIQTVSSTTNALGAITYKTNSYTELAHGMHVFENGQWRESRAVVEPDPLGAVAQYGQIKVRFKTDIYSPGSIEATALDGSQLRHHVLGLALLNRETGETRLIAACRSASGEILTPNQVIYRDCFLGLKADMWYIVGTGMLEANVILLEQPSLPPGFKPETTRLEIMTEFLSPALPVMTPHLQKTESDPILRPLMAEPDVTDYTLEWPLVRMGLGTAFALSADMTSGDARERIPVAKWFGLINSRYILVESVELADI